jgi:hypothetical protein
VAKEEKMIKPSVLAILLILTAFLYGCGDIMQPCQEPGLADNPTGEITQQPTASDNRSMINPDGSVLHQRIKTPPGFERIEADDGSFAGYLRNLPLKPDRAKVMYYDGRTKGRNVHVAVIDMDIGDRNLQQCADAVMRLRAEYLFTTADYQRIHFNFTNGFRADYSKWMEGYRISVNGNDISWVKRSRSSTDYREFRKYLDMVFAYAGTLSLSKELESVPVDDMRIGDVFIKGGSPGHCAIVVDMARNSATGEEVFLLAQSYMPAQDIHVLKNPSDQLLSPWYNKDFGETLSTPEWTFTRDQLKRFRD